MSFFQLSLSRTATMARHVARMRVPPCRRMMSTTPRPYKVIIGASFAGKPAEYKLPKHRRQPVKEFPEGSDIARWKKEMVAWPKAFPCQSPGEDFFYVQQMREDSGLSFGVADGVGGWIDVGVDPALFSQALMYHAHRYSKNAWAGEPEIDPLNNYEEREQVEGWEMTPIDCLELAHGGVLREKTVEAGSSTACIININTSNGILRAANLGDSGFSIIRSSNVFYKQAAQTHYFNCPKQLSKLPLKNKKFDSAYVDSPREADTYETKLRDGDIILAYTDGVSDNVFSSELAQLCSLVSRQGGPEETQAQDIADRLVQYSRTCMVNQKRISPFENAAARAGVKFKGGKVDDATVVVAIIRETI